MNLGGECNPASCTVGLTEIGAAVAAAPCDSVLFGTTPRGSSSNLGDGECSPSATGTGLSEFDATIAAASHDCAAATAPSRDHAIAAAAFIDGIADLTVGNTLAEANVHGRTRMRMGCCWQGILMLMRMLVKTLR